MIRVVPRYMLTGQRFAATPETGGCPVCHCYSAVVNIGCEHWAVCRIHRTCWPIGQDRFAVWQSEDPQTHADNFIELRNYAECKPWFPSGTKGGV
jgi:hypothetical protein